MSGTSNRSMIGSEARFTYMTVRWETPFSSNAVLKKWKSSKISPKPAKTTMSASAWKPMRASRAL